ncbi:hypothetical protein V6Z12_D08G155300 [Gossypium hirsutum]
MVIPTAHASTPCHFIYLSFSRRFHTPEALIINVLCPALFSINPIPSSPFLINLNLPFYPFPLDLLHIPELPQQGTLVL